MKQSTKKLSRSNVSVILDGSQISLWVYIGSYFCRRHSPSENCLTVCSVDYPEDQKPCFWKNTLLFNISMWFFTVSIHQSIQTDMNFISVHQVQIENMLCPSEERTGVSHKPPTDWDFSNLINFVQATAWDMDLINLGTTSNLMYADCMMTIPTETRAMT